MLLPLRGVATPGHGEGEGSAGDKFRVSGTQETVEGAGANEVSGVLSEASCCRCGAPLIKKRRGRPLVDLLYIERLLAHFVALSELHCETYVDLVVERINRIWNAAEVRDIDSVDSIYSERTLVSIS